MLYWVQDEMEITTRGEATAGEQFPEAHHDKVYDESKNDEK